MELRLTGIALLLLVLLPLCTGTSEQNNESTVPTIDINISIEGKMYHIHVDRNTTKEFDRIVAIIDELLKTVNKG